ncbi:retrograde regulation protein 2 [Cordyceps fumosorosea ARSEF 2679]|uniref:Retrograde regulation protein 2 n=1 Tax=Cordyceps fumosorosea (strain ARSEF 2679) TaxID=1081104 RepID=A0A168EI65_CORFA|nr:retrograde regulation protein 2 [Cordyceps fumosorosea ARSEF 2679]OAA73838.1 retrograde regulation protein 2 [Cordyceps fumosorosea ARSEF 2679]
MAVTDIVTIDNLSTKLPQWHPGTANHLYAIVDMGSNGVRFSITSLAPPFSRLLNPLFSTRAAISLFDALTPSPDGSGLIFPEQTIIDVAEAVASFHHVAVAHGVPRAQMYIFATEAMRRADNAGDILEAIRAATGGLGVQILAPEVETLCGAVMGTRSSLVGVPGGALFLDLGGGSVQMTWVDTSTPDYMIKAAIAGSSMPYGAAKLIRVLEQQSVQTQEAEIDTLRTGMKSVYDGLCTQFPALKTIKEAYERGEDANVDVYMCGGGFRGYGTMLMHDDAISPYPIPSISTYTVDGSKFKETHRMLSINTEYSGKIYGLSKRRRRQFPAIVHVVEAFISAVPNIGRVTFSGGSNRQGALQMMLPPEIRESNPLEVLANIDPADRPLLNAGLELLLSSLPDPAIISRMPTIVAPGLGYLFIKELWTRAGHEADTNASIALHTSIIRDPGCPGLTHLSRALLGIALATRWGSFLSPADAQLERGLVAIINRYGSEALFWTRYLGAVAGAIAEILPFSPASVEELKRVVEFSSEIVQKENSRVVKLSIGIACDHARRLDESALIDNIKSATKNKEEGCPKKVSVTVYKRA